MVLVVCGLIVLGYIIEDLQSNPYTPNNTPKKSKSVNKYLIAIAVFISPCYTVRVLKSKSGRAFNRSRVVRFKPAR